LLNPKAYLFFVVVAPEFLNGRTLGLGEALTLAVVTTGIATAIHLAIVLAGSRAQAWLTDPARTKWVRRGFAVVMLGVAVSFLAIKAG
jgi:threonine/homoserine/homoserine lactone efflux protein